MMTSGSLLWQFAQTYNPRKGGADSDTTPPSSGSSLLQKSKGIVKGTARSPHRMTKSAAVAKN